MRKFILFFHSFLLLQGVLFGQWRVAPPLHLGSDDGFNVQWARLMQDSVGHIYLATERGMYRYDGHDFEHFAYDANDSTSIAPGPVHVIYESRDGLLYIGSESAPLQSFDRRTGKFTSYDTPANHDGKQTIRSIFEDDSGRLWLGANQGQLVCMTPNRKIEQVYHAPMTAKLQGRVRQEIGALIRDRSDKNLLWLYIIDYNAPDSPVPWYGFMKFRMDTGQFERIPCGGHLQGQGPNDNLYAHFGETGVIEFDPITRTCKEIFIHRQLPKAGIINDVMVREENVLLATERGIASMDWAYNFNWIYESDECLFPFLFEDRRKRIWLSESKGLYIFEKNRNNKIDYYSLDTFDFRNRIYPGRMSYIVDDANILLTPGGFSQDYDQIICVPVNKEKPAFTISPDYTPYAHVQDGQGRLWVTGSGRVHRYKNLFALRSKKPDFKMDMKNSMLWQLQYSGDGWISGAAERELYWWHETSHELNSVTLEDLKQKFQLRTDVKIQGSVAQGNKLYLYTNTVYELDMNSGQLRMLDITKPINKREDPLLDVEINSTGQMWVAANGGLGLFNIEADSLRIIKLFRSAQNYISGINELHLAGNQIWAFCSTGLIAIDLSTEEIRSFDTSDGLQQNFCDPRQVITLPDGRIASVNANGLILFHPDSLWKSHDPRSIKTIIKDIRLDGQSISSEVEPNYIREINISPEISVVDVWFQALSLPTDKGVKYSYRLIGHQDDWIDIGENKLVSFSSLPPGDFRLEIKSASSTSDAPIKHILFHVTTPLTATWYFRLAVSALLVTLLLLAQKWRIDTIKKRHENKLEHDRKMMEIELKALRSQMNPHFMFNSLNSIKSFILQSKPMQAAEYLSDFSHLVRMILQHSRERLISLSDEIETLILYIDLEKMRLEDQFTFSCEIDSQVNMDNIWIPPLLLQPFIENAIWHGLKEKGDGHLSLNIFEQNGRVICEIEDNGIGRIASMKRQKAEQKIYRSLGMDITNERIEIINLTDNLELEIAIQDLEDSSHRPAGTKVTISFMAESI